MTNPYYNGGSFPATGSAATSASMRAELASITTGFDKLPTLSGNNNKLVAVNSSGTALEATTSLPTLTVNDATFVVQDNADNTKKFRFEASSISALATRVLTVPDANLTLVGEATTQTLTNKTINLASNTLVATSAQLAAAVTDETGSGALVFGTGPTIDGPTVSNNLTLSSGTANGVLYLNGSKVATSGSALVFDGTNLGIGTSPTTKLDVNGITKSQGNLYGGTSNTTANVLAYANVATGGAGFSQFLFANTSTETRGYLTYSHASDALLIGTAATTKATLDSSGNLGLGVTPSTASTFKLLQLPAGGIIGTQGNSVALTSNAVWNSGWKYATTAAASYYAQDTGTHGWFTAASGTAGNAITFTQAMTLDASGNLGLGVTPSAWSGTTSVFQNPSGAIYSFSGNSQNGINSNAYYNGTNWIYRNSTPASDYFLQNGQHVWRVAASGTAGNAITFTQAMTLDASGNLGVGTTSPDAKLDVAGTALVGLFGSESANNAYIGFKYNSTILGYVGNGSGVSGGSAATEFSIGSTGARALTFGTNDLERARITSGGDFVLAQAGSYTKDFVQASENFIIKPTAQNGFNPYIIYRPDASTSNRYFRFGAYNNLGNDIEWMRIVDGNLLVGTTSPPAYGSKLRVEGGIESFSSQFNVSSGTSTPFELVNRSASAGFDFYVNSGGTLAARITSGGELCIGTTAAATGARLTVNGVGSTNATFIVHFANSSTTRCFAVEGAGRILTGTAAESPYNNTTASAANMFVDSAGILFRSTSSLKYKTDVQNATHGLAEVMQLRPVTYKGKNDGDTVFGGLIAEEVHAAGLTEFVQYAEDGSPDALAYGNMVSLLTKAIQEQQALITDLRARVAALEAA